MSNKLLVGANLPMEQGGIEFPPEQVELPVEALRDFVGKWVALDASGSRIIAHAERLTELELRLAEVGENPEEVSFLFVPHGDRIRSGSELR